MFDFESLVREAEKKGSIINVPQSLLVINTTLTSDGTPYVEFKNNECFYISSERGYEFFREKITDLNELLYRIFDRITTRMAIDYELDHRIENQDCRRLIFDKKLELLRKIDAEWENREKKNIKKILTESPYDDFASTRAAYCKRLRGDGMPEADINKMAYKKYPSPQNNLKISTQSTEKTYWEKYFED